MRRGLTIGKLAERAGVSVETIRYYQRRDLLEEPEKPLGGYRRDPSDMEKRVRFIKRAQALGFRLEEVAGLLRLDALTACTETRELAARKLELIEENWPNSGSCAKAWRHWWPNATRASTELVRSFRC